MACTMYLASPQKCILQPGRQQQGRTYPTTYRPTPPRDPRAITKDTESTENSPGEASYYANPQTTTGKGRGQSQTHSALKPYSSRSPVAPEHHRDSRRSSAEQVFSSRPSTLKQAVLCPRRRPAAGAGVHQEKTLAI
jgi:hypothetical protein